MSLIGLNQSMSECDFFILVRMFKRNNPNFMKWQHLNFFESFYRNHFVFHAKCSWSWTSQSIFSTYIVAILDENRCIRNWANAKQRKTLKKIASTENRVLCSFTAEFRTSISWQFILRSVSLFLVVVNFS